MRLPVLLVSLVVLLAGAGASRAQPILDVGAAPGLDATGRAEYGRFLLANLPRAFAVSSNGRAGWAGPAPDAEVARAVALQRCAAVGGTDCAIYADDLDVVWRGRPRQVAPPPGPLLGTGNYAFVPDARYFWRGPREAAGVYVWAHGKGPAPDTDNRGLQPQAHVRPFNNAGFDVVRFDRAPLADDPNRAFLWLRDGLGALRRLGYRRVVAGGESRGGWTSLQLLDAPGAADAVVAVSPSAQGTATSSIHLSQADDLDRILADAVRPGPRVAVAQFALDLYAGDLDARAAALRAVRPRLGGLLLIDRPSGFSGHGAAAIEAFAERYGACLLRFATAASAPDGC